MQTDRGTGQEHRGRKGHVVAQTTATARRRRVNKRSGANLIVVDDLGEVTDLQRAYSMCHADGHEWRHLPGATPVGDTLERISTCGDCGTRRRSYYPRSGAKPTRRYDYPDGYVQHGVDGLSRNQWRRVMIVSLG